MGDVAELLDYWADFPPSHLVLRAAFLKMDAPRRSKRSMSESARKDISGLLYGPDAMPPGALGVAKEMPPHLVALADWAEEQTALMSKHA